MSSKTLDELIELTPETAGGKPRIRGHRIRVQDIAIWHERLGQSADESSAPCVERVRFLADEHLPNAVSSGLRARGVDAATAAEAGQLRASDAALLAFARSEGRVLITADADHRRV